MSLEPNTFEFNLFFILTIILLVAKFLIIVYIGVKIYSRKKETGKMTFGFMTSMFILFICLFISRLIYTMWDFLLTEFDPSRFYIMPNVIYWKIGALINAFGYAIVLFTIDKKIFDFKFKGIFADIVIIVGIVQIIYPTNSSQDFDVISTISLLSNVISIVFPTMFFYIGLKSPQSSGYRKLAFLIAIGVIIYAIGSNLVIEGFIIALESIFGTNTRITLYFLFLVFKITGLIILTNGVIAFVQKFSKM